MERQREGQGEYHPRTRARNRREMRGIDRVEKSHSSRLYFAINENATHRRLGPSAQRKKTAVSVFADASEHLHQNNILLLLLLLYDKKLLPRPSHVMEYTGEKIRDNYGGHGNDSPGCDRRNYVA